MAYKNKTRFYRLPSMGFGDVLTQEQQWIKDSIMDNLLYAATFGCDKCFLEQGNYYIQQHQNDCFCYLIIQPTDKDTFSLMGILNYRMFFSKERLVVGKLCYDSRYYVYVQFDEQMQTDPSCFRIVYDERKRQINEYNMLLCVVQTYKNNLKVYTDVNKVFAKNILAHTKDYTNPHGEKLLQKDLYVFNELKVKGNEITGSIYDSFITQSDQYVYNIPEKKNVIFVTAYPESIKAGNISWKIEGDKIIFDNSGESGVKVNIKLDVR